MSVIVLGLTIAAATQALCVIREPEVLLGSLVLGTALIVLTVVDARDLRLPDIVTLPLTGAGLVAAWLLPLRPVADHAVGAVVGYAAFSLTALLYRRIRGRDGLGLGDAKLLAAAGAWLTWRGLPSVVLLGCLAALVWVAVSAMRRGPTVASQPVPFGPPLALATWIVWLYGPLGQFS